MRIISFNINGIRARFHQLEAIRDTLDPDVLALQETKVDDPQFPLEAIQEMGWHVEFFGQKAHYGVALLSKQAPIKVQKGYLTDSEEDQKRFIHGAYQFGDQVVNVINGYFPQGESMHHETKFPAKRKYYADLNEYILTQGLIDQHTLVVGDMNISPEDQDIGIGESNQKRWLKQGKCSFLPEEREWYQSLLGLGLTDTYRKHFPQDNSVFSWFDYRSRGFNDDPKRGLRIDHILCTPSMVDQCTQAGISYDIRGMEKPSDHAPIWADFDGF